MAREVQECPKPAGSWRPMPLSTWSAASGPWQSLGHGLSYFVDFQAWGYSPAAPSQECPQDPALEEFKARQREEGRKWQTATGELQLRTRPESPSGLTHHISSLEAGNRGPRSPQTPHLLEEAASWEQNGSGHRTQQGIPPPHPGSQAGLALEGTRDSHHPPALQLNVVSPAIREHFCPPSLPDPGEWAIKCQMPEEATAESHQGSGKGRPTGCRTFLFTS